MTTTMNTGAASLSDEQKRAAITACALMIKGICLTTPNAEWTERIENRIHYLLRQIATTPQADAAPIDEKALLAAGAWANADTPIAEALAYRDGYVAGYRAAIAAGGAQEPIYQARLANGSWQDTNERAYRYNIEHCPEATRIVYAAPLANEASKPAEPTSYDGLTEEFADEVARLCNDAPGSRNAVYAALEHCNAEIVPAAPSVEQDERGAFRDTLRAALKSYRRANPSRYLNDDQVDASDSEFVSDLMTYVPVGEKARAGSTSANVAQGAESVSDEHAAVLWRLARMTDAGAWTAELRKAIAPPAQTAITDDARKRAAKAIVEVYLGFPASDREPCELDLKAADAAYAALTAAQSASGDTK